MDKGNIKPINCSSVHKICSGQVILTLATAVKELVENSIDAGATNIEVKLKDYGSELIEVVDNGKGVKSSDFQNLTLKHHTSKIEDFSDVTFVSTFGFRGEALSSLCALSDLEITTCHCDSTVGTFLSFDHDGKLVKSTPTHRQVGTTVSVRNLFFTLPVRHKEFQRNLRREYAKMVQLLTAYCLISVNKRITCTNVTEKGKKTIVLSTSGSPSVEDNISCIYSNKQLLSLMKLTQQSPSQAVLEEYFISESMAEKSNIFKLEGYISNSNHGEGRSSTDRQFFFINGRPCDLPKVSKLINEVYHSFNKHQYPFIFLNIILTEGSADVNVTPDKRQIFIPEEKVLLAIIKSTLLAMYEKQPSQMKIDLSSPFRMNAKADFSSPDSLLTDRESESGLDTSKKRKIGSSTDNSDEEDPISQHLKNQKLDEQESICLEKNSQLSSEDQSSIILKFSEESSPSCSSNNFKPISSSKIKKLDNQAFETVNFTLTLPFREDKIIKKMTPDKSGKNKLKEILQLARRTGSSNSLEESVCKLSKNNVQNVKSSQKILNYFEKFASNSTVCENIDESKENVVKSIISNVSNVQKEETFSNDLLQTDVDEPILRKKKCKVILFNIESIKQKLSGADAHLPESEKYKYRRFRSKIVPVENENAEEELKKEISKDSFSQMEIVGQFNLGFIITKLKEDLFIIDQHATDEKYNFETLQKDMVLETQKLLNPQNLNLTVVQENILLDNLNIFEKNGFKFNINEENPVGEKIQLVSVPVSYNWRFGKEDIEELIFMLTDNPMCMVRPSRVNQMFASRACRKSVMIGTALTIPMMKKLVVHMGEIEQPWNCPHGRPTMRHLFNLELLKSDS